MQQPTDFLKLLPKAADCIAQTPQRDLPYLQILPPAWVLDDPLYAQLDALGKLYRQGRTVWAAVAWCDQRLTSGGEEAHAAEIVFDPTGSTDIATLVKIADKLAAAREGQPETRSARLVRPIPPKITTLPLQTAHLLIWRPHLPNGILSERILPVLTDDACDAVAQLPARYWMQNAFYQGWLAKGGSDAAVAFQAALELDADFWKGFGDVVRPHRGELPDLGKNAREPQNVRGNDQGKQLIRGCRWQSTQSYPRQSEKIPADNLIAEAAAKLAAGTDAADIRPAELLKYAQLRNSSLHNVQALMADEAAARALGRPAMPKVAAVVAGGKPSPVQTALMLGALYKAGCRGNSTAHLYLGYLYAKGQFVSQTLREAAHWLAAAAKSGDWRALRIQAEILLAAPTAAPEILAAETDEHLKQLHAKHAGSLKNPKQIDRMQNQFLNHPVSAQQAVRTKLEQAAVLGSPDAKIRLQELVAAEILPPSPAARQFHGIREWLHEHLSSWTPTRDEMDADITLLPENAPLLDADEGTERPAWFRIAIFGLVGLLLAVIMVLAIKIVA